MKIAIKVGGSVFCPGDKPDQIYAKRLAETLKELSGRNRLVVVVGGGKLARKMIEEAKKRNVISDEELHTLGIKASRINASFLIKELKENAHPLIPRNTEEVKKAFASKKIVVLGGFRPGQTTDAVTLQSAEAVGAELIVMGKDVKGVYDRNPKKYKDANFLPKITASGLRKMVETGSVRPGENTIVDPIAAEMIERLGKRTFVLDIRKLDNLVRAIDGKEFEGTTILKSEKR